MRPLATRHSTLDTPRAMRVTRHPTRDTRRSSLVALHSTLDTRHSTLRRRRAAAGVTLVEVVIAIFILTVGVLGIVALFPTGYTLGQRAFDRSVAALAARDALPRIIAQLKANPSLYPGSSPLGSVAEEDRVGTINAINSSTQVACLVRGDVTPTYTGLLGGCYLVITSGTARGRVCRITGSSGGTITCSAATFRTASSNVGDPIRVGDHYAVIGSQTNACFPVTFFTTGGNNRTRECANHGDKRPRREASGNPPWEYAYGCILSPPSKEMPDLYRVDVFVFRGFDDTGALDEQTRPVGHFVTYISRLEDYTNP